MDALIRLVEFAPITDQQLVDIGNVLSIEIDDTAHTNVDEIADYRYQLIRYFETIHERLRCRSTVTTDWIVDNLRCPEI